MKNIIALASLLMTSVAFATTVAVVDSGTDYKHEFIAPHQWMNAIDLPDNDADEDGNDYKNDIYGWNFAENNNQVIDYKYLDLFTDDVKKFFQIQALIIYGNASPEMIAWYKEKIADPVFVNGLMVYANFMHGSHVTGINVGGDTSLNAIAVKLLATEHISLPVYKNKNMLSRWLFKKLLAQAAQANVDSLATVVDYIKGHEAKVMNGSFGVGYNENTKAAIAQIYKTVFLATPSEDDVEEFTMYFLNELLVRGEKFVANSPDLLFVFAAGNDGTNNDFYPSYPTNLSKFENVIAVAATMDERAIASFSNRGVAMVDVAAPGVAISSSVPGDNYLRVSGTSQAAPYVARIAGLVRDINPSLKPADVKKIIAATVDAKTWLADRVKSGGLVNLDRATSAARFSLHWGIDESIRAAFDVIPTRPDLGTDIKTQMTPGLFLPIMPTGITWPF